MEPSLPKQPSTKLRAHKMAEKSDCLEYDGVRYALAMELGIQRSIR